MAYMLPSQGLWVEKTRNKKHEHKHTTTDETGRMTLKLAIRVRIGGNHKTQDNNKDVQRATSGLSRCSHHPHQGNLVHFLGASTGSSESLSTHD